MQVVTWPSQCVRCLTFLPSKPKIEFSRSAVAWKRWPNPTPTLAESWNGIGSSRMAL